MIAHIHYVTHHQALKDIVSSDRFALRHSAVWTPLTDLVALVDSGHFMSDTPAFGDCGQLMWPSGIGRHLEVLCQAVTSSTIYKRLFPTARFSLSTTSVPPYFATNIIAQALSSNAPSLSASSINQLDQTPFHTALHTRLIAFYSYKSLLAASCKSESLQADTLKG